MALDINRYIAKIRAETGSNFLALALQEIQNYSQAITSPAATATPAVKPVVIGGGAASSSTATPFQFSVNGALAPNNSANLNSSVPAPNPGMQSVVFKMDATVTPPNVSGSTLALANNLIAVNAVPYSATPVFDTSLGNVQEIKLTGNVTSFTVINGTPGQIIAILWLQDSAGGHTIAGAPANVRGFTTPGTTLSTYSAQSFAYDGTNWVATATGSTDI